MPPGRRRTADRCRSLERSPRLRSISSTCCLTHCGSRCIARVQPGSLTTDSTEDTDERPLFSGRPYLPCDDHGAQLRLGMFSLLYPCPPCYPWLPCPPPALLRIVPTKVVCRGLRRLVLCGNSNRMANEVAGSHRTRRCIGVAKSTGSAMEKQSSPPDDLRRSAIPFLRFSPNAIVA